MLTPKLAAADIIPVMERMKGWVRHLVCGLVVPFDRLTMFLVLVDPTASLLGLDHELVVSESSVDEGVDERASQVGSCRVDQCG